MVKVSKTPLFTFFILITSFQLLQCNPPSNWQMFITLIFGEEQPQNNSDQTSDNVTKDNYIAQFRSDLNGHTGAIIIPLHEVEKMEKALRTELRNINLKDPNKVNQTIRSVIVDQVRTGTLNDLNDLQKEVRYGNFFITSHDYATIPNSNENNIIARLSSIPHLSGHAIAQYFGETRKNAIRDSLIKRGPKYTVYH